MIYFQNQKYVLIRNPDKLSIPIRTTNNKTHPYLEKNKKKSLFELQIRKNKKIIVIRNPDKKKNLIREKNNKNIFIRLRIRIEIFE